MSMPKPPNIRIVGTGETATVTVNRRTWSNYIVHIAQKAKSEPTFASLLVEPYTVSPDFDIILVPSDATEWTKKPTRKVKFPKKRGRKPKHDLR